MVSMNWIRLVAIAGHDIRASMRSSVRQDGGLMTAAEAIEFAIEKRNEFSEKDTYRDLLDWRDK